MKKSKNRKKLWRKKTIKERKARKSWEKGKRRGKRVKGGRKMFKDRELYVF